MSGWSIGFIVATVVVVAVVVLLLLLIVQARGAAKRAGAIVGELEGIEENTAGVWEVRRTNQLLDRVTDSARAAREEITGARSAPSERTSR